MRFLPLLLILPLLSQEPTKTGTKFSWDQIEGWAAISSILVMTPNGLIPVQLHPSLQVDFSVTPPIIRASSLAMDGVQIAPGNIPMFANNSGGMTISPLSVAKDGKLFINGSPLLLDNFRSVRTRLSLTASGWKGTTGGECKFADVYRNGQLLEPLVDYSISQDQATWELTVTFPVTTNAVAANIVTVICR